MRLSLIWPENRNALSVTNGSKLCDTGQTPERPSMAGLADHLPVSCLAEGLLYLFTSLSDVDSTKHPDAGKRAYSPEGKAGHSVNRSVVDLVCDYSARTPTQAGADVREQIERRRQEAADALGRVRVPDAPQAIPVTAAVRNQAPDWVKRSVIMGVRAESRLLP